MHKQEACRNVIVVRSGGGFGNQVFYLIFALYLSQKYITRIKFCSTSSFHSNKEIHPISDVFKGLTQHIDFISVEEMQELETERGVTPVTSQQFDLHTLAPTLDQSTVFHTNPFANCYQMYEALDSSYRACLTINQDLISDYATGLVQTPYIAINIRYGDKLCYALKDNTFFSSAHEAMHQKYVLYTPSFYKDIIRQLRDTHDLPIYIVTDSPSLVENYVLNENRNIATIINTPYLDDFYLLNHAEIGVASHSTFSFSAFFLNQSDHIYLLKKPLKELADYELPEDNAIPPTWTLIDKPDYILNNKQALLQEMASHFGQCEHFKQWYLQQGDEYKHIKKLFG